jgi:dihydroorotate dehydrogenase
MLRYRHLWPIIKRLPPEFAHRLGLLVLRLPMRLAVRPPDAPFLWRGLRFRNRVGIAAGFDKNGVCLRGIERLGAGFVEVGTVLVSPWKGNPLRPRLARLLALHGLWNRIGFTSHGLEKVQARLAAFPRGVRRGMVVACNIGPHPGNMKKATGPTESLATAREELLRLAEGLFPHADLFVINLSSPNTPGLRSLLQSEELSSTVVLPVRQLLRRLDAAGGRRNPTPLLVKLPPEDAGFSRWSAESLQAVVGPLVEADACDGFVAVNTSSRLALETVPYASREMPGGVSGAPLRPEALRVIALLRGLVGKDRLLIGCGGIMEPGHVQEFIQAGADLVETYSGLVYQGPGFVAACAAAAKQAR